MNAAAGDAPDIAGRGNSALATVLKSRGLMALGILVVLSVLSRAATFNNPVIGFDEQFYLLVGNRMLDGAVPYVDIWDRKPIGLFLIYMASSAIGPDPFLQYKLVAFGCVVATACVVYAMARKAGAGTGAALCAAAFYILMLGVCEGEAGQAPVFYNLPVSLAAVIVQSVWARVTAGQRAHLAAQGCAAMLLIGLALQIKYTVVFEGVFFGLALLTAAHRVGMALPRIAFLAAVWILCALTPTAMALAWYWHLGELPAFLFANFFSIYGRLPDPASARLEGLLTIAGILLPLGLVYAASRLRPASGESPRRRPDFAESWLLAALAGFLVFGSFLAPGYALPIIAPLCLCCARSFESERQRRLVAYPLLIFVGLAGQAVIAISAAGKGDRDEAMAVAAAATPQHGGCIWVYDGYPALYLLTQSCLPSRWVFPGHLNTANEASKAAIGVDPVTEVRRILAAKPEVIIDDAPLYALANPSTRALVNAALQRDYRLAASIRTGKARLRLVYRRKDEALPGCCRPRPDPGRMPSTTLK